MLAATGVGLSLIAGCSSSESDRESGDANSGGTDTPESGDANSGGTDTPESGDANSDEDNTEDSEESTTVSEPTEESLVELQDHSFYNNGQYDAGVEGTLKNVSGDELSYVAVEVFFLDSEGVQIGEGLDNTTDLAADRTWAFDAGYLDSGSENIAEYEIQTDVSNY